MTKVVIGSVFADYPRSQEWYNLQLKYLHKTTIDFEHVVFSYSSNIDFNYSSKVFTSSEKIYSSKAHQRGLNVLLEYFKTCLDCEYFLFLDSDSFPIRFWLDSVIEKLGKEYNVVAAVRFENLDTFAHPCAFFVDKIGIKDLKFGSFNTVNLLKKTIADTNSNVNKFYPLIRTNKLNYHPLMYGVYGDLFYHHAAGSRKMPGFRSNKYYNIKTFPSDEEDKYQELINDTDNFINKLIYTPLDASDVKNMKIKKSKFKLYD